MGRRVWIISAKKKITQAVRDAAKANNCPEIVIGIPPILRGVVFKSGLPRAYEEPESPPGPPVRDLGKEIDILKERVIILEGGR